MRLLQAAMKAKVTRLTIKAWIEKGAVKAVKKDSGMGYDAWDIDEESLDEYLEKRAKC